MYQQFQLLQTMTLSSEWLSLPDKVFIESSLVLPCDFDSDWYVLITRFFTSTSSHLISAREKQANGSITDYDTMDA